MKELSIEEKARRYDEAIERAKNTIKVNQTIPDIVECVESLFTELKESEDEKIRKALINGFNKLDKNAVWYNGITNAQILAWLEKQGEQKPADEVEPKFKVGDWISGYYTNYKVLSVNNDGYVVEDVDGNKINILFENEKFHHLWMIQDAKDGDVLVCIGKYGQEIGIVKEYVGKYGGCNKCFETYCFVDWGGIFRTGEYIGSKEIYPATKEQRDLLSQKMKEAGYEWSDKDRKLIKIVK